MANKKTKRELFGEIKEVVAGNAELVAFVDHELELLDKKANSKNSKVNEEHTQLMETIKAELTRIGRSVTITELQKESEALADYSNQKLSAMLKKLVDNGEVTKMVDKKKSYFLITE